VGAAVGRLFVVLARGAGGHRPSVAQDLGAAKEGTPSKGDIESWQKYRSEVGTAYKNVTDFYTGSDKYLERWFPNILLGADGDPARDNFMTRYMDEGRQLEEKLAKAPYNVAIGLEPEEGRKAKFGFNWEAVTPNDWATITAHGPNDEKNVLRELQKRFWARQRLANIILNGGVKVARIVDFRFFKPLHERLNQAPWQQYPSKGSEVIQWQGVNAATNGQPIGFAETELPNELGKTLTFGSRWSFPIVKCPRRSGRC
jgi:hypothetical protein